MRSALPVLRLFGALLLLLTARPLSAQNDWAPLPHYRYRGGGRGQTRRIMLCEDFGRPSAGFRQLRDAASIDRLLRLARGRDRAMRLYAAYALVDRRYPRLAAVFAYQLRHDPAIRYEYWQGSTRHVDYMHASEGFWRRTHALWQAATTPADSLFYLRQQQQLDSVAFQRALRGRHVHESLLEEYLLNDHAYPGSYALVRELFERAQAAGELNSNVVVALAAYQRPDDLPRLQQLSGGRLWQAIQAYPAPAFWPRLAARAGQEDSYGFFAAVASYRNARAARLLDSLYQHRPPASAWYASSTAPSLANALSDYYHPGFDSLLMRLWQDYRIITPTSLRALRRHPAAAAIFGRGLLSFTPGDASFQLYGLGWRSLYAEDTIMHVMLTTLQRQDTARFRQVVQHTVQVCHDFSLEAICRLIGQQQLRWAQPQLLAALRQQPYSRDLFPLAEALLAFPDAALPRQVGRILHEKKLDPGGYYGIQHLNELLARHGLPLLPLPPKKW